MGQYTKDELVKIMRANIEQGDTIPITINDDYWTMADLFIRQWLNNGGNGFGMVNVDYMYSLLKEHKDLLIKENMVSKRGANNSGFPLWNDYNF